MNENSKTGVFAIIAACVALVSWVTMPKSNLRSTSVDSQVGKSLYEDYDPDSATSLKIVRFNSDTAKREDFEVARDPVSKAWTIPSRAGYPADAAKQMSEAANAFLNVMVLDIVSDSREKHKKYGVLEPDEEKVSLGDEGVGVLVRMKNEKATDLVHLVIGKQVKDRPNQRYVRVPSQDRIYAVELDIDSLSTDFSRWIEGDLLKLSSNDVETIGIRDYVIIQTNEGGQLDPKFDADVTFSTTDGKWSADKILVHEGAKSTARELTAQEQVNGTKLNEMKNALDSLRIVDVLRKPKGLASDLKVEKGLLDDRESIVALLRRGFIPQKGADGNTEIFATSGELLVTLKDGVQYLVRFGNSTGASSDTEEKKDASAAEGVKLDRYMLVSARLNEGKYPPAAIKPVPDTYDDLLKLEGAPLPEAVPSVPNIESSGAVASDSKMQFVSFQPPAGEPENQPPAVEQPPAPEQTPVAEQPPAEGTPQPTETNAVPAEQPPVTEKAAAPAEQPPVQLTDEEKKERLEAARERITKENQRLIDERNEKLDGARKKVSELNARFADWFYVISETEYKRLRIQLEELIQPATAGGPPGGGGAPSFNPGNFLPK